MTTDNKHKFAAIVLAAGKGVRMQSSLPKVMHELAGKPLIGHVLAALKALSPEKVVVITPPEAGQIKETCLAEYPGCEFAAQDKQLGTGHAAGCAGDALKGYQGTVLIVCGDTPLLTPQTLAKALATSESAEVVVVGMRPANPAGYGRLIVDAEGQLEEIIEERDATQEQKKIDLCNSGIIAASGRYLFELLNALTDSNAAGEYYLTDIVSEADKRGLHCRVVEADVSEMQGINTRRQLADAERAMQDRLRCKALDQGVTLLAAETVHFTFDTELAKDVTVHPYVVFGPGVSIEESAEIKSFSHLEGAKVKKNAVVGPYARLRPGAVIGEEAHVGNFVEIKKSTLGPGAKANHLSYIGDAEVGEGTNVGAGTITCNYDGVNKHKTTIGSHAFIGSNTALVAPVHVGDGAIIGAGSVITENVETDALAIARAGQVSKPGRAKALKNPKEG